jgi:hypothetical protein
MVEADPESQTGVRLRSLARTPPANALRSPPGKEGEMVPAIARVLAQAASYLCDQPAAWRAADDAQRNALARMVFVQVRIKDDWVAAVEPQPSFTPSFRWDCHVQRLSSGSDRDRLGEIDVFALPLVPFLYPERLLRLRQRAGIGGYAPVAKEPLIPRERWTEVAARAQREGLRTVARNLGLSHETVRMIVRRVKQDRLLE